MIKKKLIQIYFVCGISIDQLTPEVFLMPHTFEDDKLKASNTLVTETAFRKEFNGASSFSKQSSNYGRRKRNKSV
tara:strand:+ start:203 stop:427 length:225 start_codon:yes stop_codon:yes gene_type:complete